MCKAALVFALSILLTCSAHAGIMGNDSPAPPPAHGKHCKSPAPTGRDGATTDERNAAGVRGDEATLILVRAALELFAVLPSLL